MSTAPAPRRHKKGCPGKTTNDTRGKPAPPVTASHPIPIISISASMPAAMRARKPIAPPSLLARLGNEA